MIKPYNSFLTAFFACIFSTSLLANNFNKVAFFGDSMSDSGNLFSVVGKPGAPYFNGVFSNGYTYAEYINQHYNLESSKPSIKGGNNYAWGGAKANMDVVKGELSIPGIESQIKSYLSDSQKIKNLNETVHIIFIGANDLFHVMEEKMDLLNAKEYLQTSAKKVADSVTKIKAAGGKRFIIPEVPDLSLTPRYLHNETVKEYTNIYNTHLKSIIPTHNNINLSFLDTSSFLKEFSKTTAKHKLPCLTSEFICNKPSEHVFFDDIHPSAETHKAFSEILIAKIQSVLQD
jgi:phospholipase/lecithinase/hemolysin